MPYKTGEIAKRIGVNPATVRYWADEYSEYLSETAGRRAPGAPRKFTDNDAAIMATIAAGRDKGLTHDQITAIIQQGSLETLPDIPTPEETEVRQSIALIAKPEYERALDRIQQLQSDLERAYGERDKAIAQWQADTTELNDRIAALERELGQAQGKLEMIETSYQQRIDALETERPPASYWLRIIIVIIALAIIAVAVAVVMAGQG